MIESLNATRESSGLLENRLQRLRPSNETRSRLKDAVARNLVNLPADSRRRCLETFPQRREIHRVPAPASHHDLGPASQCLLIGRESLFCCAPPPIRINIR